MKAVIVAIIAVFFSVPGQAQSQTAVAKLPNAPVAPGLSLTAQNVQDAAPAATTKDELTRAQAEQMALKNNPRISVSKLLAMAQHQVVREARSAELPMAYGNITAEKALDASRISAGSLTASRLLTHAGAGASVTQLITDFGRTHNLVLTQNCRREQPMLTHWRPGRKLF
jgi:outer membrane protein